MNLNNPAPFEKHWDPVFFVWAVWGALFVAALGFTARYGVPMPIMDNWHFVPVLLGEEPISLAWLWEPYNQHRMVLPRLIAWICGQLSGNDFRPAMFFSALAFAFVSLSLMLVARRLRGHWSYTDAFFPMVLLHWGHDDLFITNMGSNHSGVVLMVGAILLLILTSVPNLTRWRAILCLAFLFCLPMFGANGAAEVPALTIWLGCAAFLCWKSGKPGGRREAVFYGLLACLAVTFVGIQFAGIQPSLENAPATGLSSMLGVATRFLGNALAPPGDFLWSFWPYCVIVLCFFTAAILVRVAWVLPAERLRAIGLLAVMAAVGCSALALGWGRGGYGKYINTQSRFISQGLPLMFCLYFSGMLYFSPPLGRLLQFAFFAFACATLWPQSINGLERARERYRNFESFERDLRGGLSLEEVAQRHQGTIHPKKEKLLEGLQIMQRRGWKFFPRPSGSSQSRNTKW